jgi:hypothetical protein
MSYTRGLRAVSRRTNIPPRRIHDGLRTTGDILGKSGPFFVENIFVIVDKIEDIHHDPANVPLDAFRVIYCVSVLRRLSRTIAIMRKM